MIRNHDLRALQLKIRLLNTVTISSKLSYQPPCDGHKSVDYSAQWSLVNILDIDPMVAGMKVFGDHWVFIPMVKARMKFQAVDKHPMVTIDL